MKPSLAQLTIASLLTIFLIVGCGDNTPDITTNPTTQQSRTPATPEDDHGDSHSDETGHGEHGSGPHGGTIADWGGGKYHVEFVVDHSRKEATVYILGNDEKTPVTTTSESLLLTIKQPQFQIDLLPLPLDGEGDGNCSRFVGTHDELGTVMEFEGIISGEIDGTPYAGNFKEKVQ